MRSLKNTLIRKLRRWTTRLARLRLRPHLGQTAGNRESVVGHGGASDTPSPLVHFGMKPIDPNKVTADLALSSLNELRSIEPAIALPKLRLIREEVGRIESDDPMERSDAWWEICQLCAALSRNPNDAANEDRWEGCIKAAKAWCAIYQQR